MYHIHTSDLFDMPGWLQLAKEVEPLFGPMVESPDFFDALSKTILGGTAFCLRDEADRENCGLCGGIIISKENNSIEWFVVAQKFRNTGVGKRLLKEALVNLNQTEPITVNTFDESVPDGKPARKLYLSMGFRDSSEGPVNPAGIKTVIMTKPGFHKIM